MPRKPTGKRSTTSDGTVTVHGKAGNGEGSVYFTRDGRWRATFRAPGEQRARTVSAATRDKVLAKRAQKLEELANALCTTPVGQWLHSQPTPDCSIAQARSSRPTRLLAHTTSRTPTARSPTPISERLERGWTELVYAAAVSKAHPARRLACRCPFPSALRVAATIAALRSRREGEGSC